MVDVLCVFQILSAKQGIILWLPHLTLIHWKREITCAERSRSKGSKQIDHPSNILNFQYEPTYKYELYINNSLHLARKYARIFVRGHYLFGEANSFPRAKLEENCEL